MADILIRGMEMPLTCYDNCPCQGAHWCNPLKETTEPMTGKRLDVCPLVEIHTPHGRLIDADAFCRVMATLERIDPITAAGVIAYINAAPTIIEAEGVTK